MTHALRYSTAKSQTRLPLLLRHCSRDVETASESTGARTRAITAAALMAACQECNRQVSQPPWKRTHKSVHQLRRAPSKACTK